MRLLLLLLLTSCAPRRVLLLENRLLVEENASLQERVVEMEGRMPARGAYVRRPTLEDVHGFLDRAGYAHAWMPGATHVRMEFAGHHASFGVTIQHFDQAQVLFLATDGYLHLEQASSTDSLVLLLVQLAALNYEVLVGKFQVNPATGEILMSVELPTVDGLGYETFLRAVEGLLQTADARYPDIEAAAAGLGI